MTCHSNTETTASTSSNKERFRLDLASWVHVDELALQGLDRPEEAPGYVGRAADGYVLIRPCLVMDLRDDGTVASFKLRWTE